MRQQHDLYPAQLKIRQPLPESLVEKHSQTQKLHFWLKTGLFYTVENEYIFTNAE